MSKEEHNKVSESSKPKIKIIHDWFIPWIFEDCDQGDMVEAWGSGGTIEEHAIGIAGLIPIQHIQNWEEIKHYYDKEETRTSEHAWRKGRTDHNLQKEIDYMNYLKEQKKVIELEDE